MSEWEADGVGQILGHRRILIIEDEAHVLDLVAGSLAKEGFEVIKCRTGAEGLAALHRCSPDLLVLDVMLPDIDGMEICRQVKWNEKTRSLPVLMVTARSEESDVVLGLGIGADDYIPKPFRLRELVARVKAALRRSYDLAGPAGVQETRRLVRPSLTIDLDRHEVLLLGKPIRLTPAEIRVLFLLASSPGAVLSREKLGQAMSQEGKALTTRILDVHVLSIRQKLGAHRELIETMRGVGYRYVDPPAARPDRGRAPRPPSGRGGSQ